jgi:hypothetical protein
MSLLGMKKPKAKISHWRKAKGRRNGLVWFFAGPSGTAKSITAGLSYQFNTEYADDWKEECPLAYEALKRGAMSEVEKIYIADTEYVWEDRLFSDNYPQIKQLFKPALDKDIIEYAEIFGEDPNTHLRSAAETLAVAKESIGELLDKLSENTVFIYDSFSEFKKDLDDDFKLSMGKDPYAISSMVAGEEAHANIRRQFYGQRNSRWKAILISIRKFPGHKILCFKTEQAFDASTHKYKGGKSNCYPTLVKGTDYFIDMALLFWREFISETIAGKEVIKNKNRTVNFKPTWGCKLPYTKTGFQLHDDSIDALSKWGASDKFNFVRILDCIAQPIIDGVVKLSGV